MLITGLAIILALMLYILSLHCKIQSLQTKNDLLADLLMAGNELKPPQRQYKD